VQCPPSFLGVKAQGFNFSPIHVSIHIRVSNPLRILETPYLTANPLQLSSESLAAVSILYYRIWWLGHLNAGASCCDDTSDDSGVMLVERRAAGSGSYF